MQQGQWAIDATKSRYFILGLILICNISRLSAQIDQSFDFQKSVIRNIRYPQDLKNACTPTFANILIDISEDGEIVKISLSGSAPKSFEKEFENNKAKFNLEQIKGIITQKKLKNCGIVIPVFYVYGQDYCVNSFEPVTYISNNYYVFNNKLYDKLVLNQEPIIVTMYKPVY